MLFTYYAKELFSIKVWLFMLTINVLSLFFTFSTSLIAFDVLIILSYFLCSTTKKQKISIVFISFIFFCVGYFVLLESGYYDLFETLFLNKATNFFMRQIIHWIVAVLGVIQVGLDGKFFIISLFWVWE